MGIRSRVIAGFAIVLLLVAGLGATSLFAIRSVVGQFDGFFLASDKNRLSAEKVQSLLKLRIAALEYRNDPTTDRAISVRAQLHTFLNEAREFGGTLSEDQELLNMAFSDIGKYALLFDRMAGLQSDIDGLIERMNDTSSLFAEAIKNIQYIARVNGTDAIGKRTGKAYQAFILAESDVRAFLLSNDTDLIRSALPRLNQGRFMLKGLVNQAGDEPEFQVAFRGAIEALSDYMDLVMTSGAQIVERNALHDDEIAQLELSIQNAFVKLGDDFAAQQVILGDEARKFGEQSPRIILFLGAAALILGLVLASLIGRSISSGIMRMAGDMEALARGELDTEVTGTDLDNELGVMAKALLVFKRNAKLVIARTKQIEKQNEQIQDALQKERELNGLQRQFVAMVSHEFRTPLGIIDGHAQRLLKKLESIEPDRARKSLTTMRVSVKRLVELMESVLAAARLEDGRIRLEPGSCALIELVTEVSSSYRDLYPDRQINLDLDELPPEIIADGKLLRQVISNLLSNAIKYSPDQDRVWLRGFVDDRGQAVISVRDEGVGIPKAEQEQLFDRFFRASTSVGIAGSGIGLHLASHLVHMHGGGIDFESVEGEGTTFYIRLPRDGPIDGGSVTEGDDRQREHDTRGCEPLQLSA
jgi:signal transduction histidine kinase